MQTITLNVKPNTFERAKDARAADVVPIIYYGKGIKENLKFVVDYQEFRRAYEKGGKSTIFTLVEDKKEFPCLIHEVQYDPVTDAFMHVDVVAVREDQTITTEIPLVFAGTAPAVKDFGGILIHNKEALHIECLPKDLVHEIAVDISNLKELHASITVGDLTIPAGIKVLDAVDITVASVAAPRTEEEAAPAPAAEAAPAEGAAAAPAEKAEGEK